MDFHFTLSVGLYHGLEVAAALKLYRKPVPQTANMIPGSVPGDKAARGCCHCSGRAEGKQMK